MPHYYFDHNATTPLAPPVRAALVAALDEVHGNASSIHHFGQTAKQRLEAARRQLARRLGPHVLPREIIFTSGGTESNNLAIRGLTRPGDHIVTTAIEHPAVLAACHGLDVTFALPTPDAIRRAIRPHTRLVSVMHANNETGSIQPLAAIAEVTRAAGIPLHSDGVQSFAKLPMPPVDLYSLSAHKIGGPKGIGALYIREGLTLAPLFFGGHHERDRRPGTENVPGAVALGVAAETADYSATAPLRDRLEAGILAAVPHATVNARSGPRLPNTSNIRFETIEGEALLIALDLRGFAVSSGSACSSGATEPSHVLLALGLTPKQARSSIRFSLGPSNTAAEVDLLIEAVTQSVAHLRRISTDHPTEALAYA